MYQELHDIGVRYNFDIRIEERGNEVIIGVPAWIGTLSDNRMSPILADLNRALINLSKVTRPSLVVYT